MIIPHGMTGNATPEVSRMSENSRHKALQDLKWETAKDLGLDDELLKSGDELTTREAGKIGGNMVKKLVEKGEETLAEQTQDSESPPRG